jgi:ELAV like protein 2/3/4
MPKERVRLSANKADAVLHQFRRPTHQNPTAIDNGSSAIDDIMSSEIVMNYDLDYKTSSAASDTSSVTSSPATCSGATADVAAENRTNLIVNYLPQSMCQEDLKTLFSTAGQLDSCKLVRDKLTGYSLGYGFVKYRTAQAANKAIQTFNGLRIQNKILKVSLARPSCDNIKGANLYVGGLPRHMTNHDLMELFAGCGQIITARILSDPNTGLTKGVGFIRFNLKSEAELAIKLRSGTVPPGATEPITVKFANQPTVNKAVANMSTPSVPQLIGTVPSGAVVSAQSSSLGTNFRFEHIVPTQCTNGTIMPLATCHIPSGAAAATTAGGPFTVCISNLPQDADDAFVLQLFQPFATIHSVHIVRDPVSNKSRGVALVTMSSYDETVHSVVRLNGQQISSENVLQVTLLNGPAAINPAVFHHQGALIAVHRPPPLGGFLTGPTAPAILNQDSIYPTVYASPSQHAATAYGLVQLPIM